MQEGELEAASAIKVEMLSAAEMHKTDVEVFGWENRQGLGSTCMWEVQEGKEFKWQCKTFQMGLGAAEKNNLT